MSEIIVRHVAPDDAAALLHIYSQPDTMANTLHLPLPSLQKWQERLNNLSPTGHSLVACIEGKVVGQLTLEVIATARRRHCATLGMGVDQDYRNRGVGKALLGAAVDLCDNWLQVTRMELTVFADNPAAIALYRHFGFEIEGTAKGYAMRQGEMIDTHYMARLK
ncbi:GNAT family N-acetyltransferase [Pantoea sp. ACRSB]|uniref:GNAT family N-acetyltransferase n=1 Tax=Pantoea sp. ACRSB TaxID=2918207 RepID=UPI0028930D95|nr:GNAT family N-acetyltransferase [Pantoea sp. ACRSB]MCG7390326.1 GNAT family N-acetyltransferase [Pantoea sp. ACRSB]